MTRTVALALKAGAEGLSPVDLLLGIVRDENQSLQFRAHCAGVVLPYVTPRLASVTVERKSNTELLERLFERARADGKLPPVIIEQKPIALPSS